MVYSPLATETHNTSQYSARTQTITMAVLHHGATTDAQWIIDVETSGSKQVSSHMVVKDFRRAGIVQEQFRAWSLSDALWDSKAMTVECANESTNGWTISAASHESLALLVADWARRYGFWPHREGDPKTWTVIGHREVYTIHGGSYATACPGGMDLNWIAKRAQEILNGDDMATPEEISQYLRNTVWLLGPNEEPLTFERALKDIAARQTMELARQAGYGTRIENTEAWVAGLGKQVAALQAAVNKVSTPALSDADIAKIAAQVAASAKPAAQPLSMPTAAEIAKATVDLLAQRAQN